MTKKNWLSLFSYSNWKNFKLPTLPWLVILRVLKHEKDLVYTHGALKMKKCLKMIFSSKTTVYIFITSDHFCLKMKISKSGKTLEYYIDLVFIVPPPSTSNSLNACFSSAICSSLHRIIAIIVISRRHYRQYHN